MSSKIAILSLVSAVLAVPHVHNRGGHNHLHKRHGAPYPVYNSTVVAGTGSSEVPSSTAPLTTTITNYSTVVDYVTVYPAVTKDVNVEVAQPATSVNAAESVCGGVVTSTYTNKVTVTVTAGSPDMTGAASSPAPSFVFVSSSVAAEGPAPTSEAPAYTPEPSTTPEEPEQTSAPELQPTSAVAPVEPISSAVVVPEPSYTPAPVTSAASVPSAPVTPPTHGAPGGGKRGLAYNDASLCSAFDGDNKVSWAYNWGQVSDGLAPSFQYVPMLWGDKAGFTGSWEKNAHASIDAGELNVLGMNEPDHTEQANMSPSVAHQFWNQYLAPLKSYNSNVRLGSPAVTNGGGAMGLTWLSNFMTECSDCQIDFCAVHWYDSATNVEYFKKHMNDAHAACGGKPIWVTEFGASGSPDQIASFLETVMSWMDSQDFIERYSYFMLKEGNLVENLIPNALGALYASL